MKQLIIITGISGYIGSSLAKYLLLDENKYVLGISRNSSGFFDMCNGDVTDNSRLFLADCDVTDKAGMSCVIRDSLGNFEERPDSIDVIHCAATTQSSKMIENPEKVYSDIVCGTENVLGVSESIKADNVVFLSSMEIYGNIDMGDERVTEDQRGYIDNKNPRSCYPLAKLEAERLCVEYSNRKGVAAKIARLAQVFGYGISKKDNRVFAQFAKSVINGNDIVLHTDGSSYGNYCEIEDAIKGILTILEKGKPGEAYNVVNEANTMTIRAMAELVVRDIAKGAINIVYDIPEDNIHGYAMKTSLKMSGKKLEELDWKAQKGLKNMYEDMIRSLTSIK